MPFNIIRNDITKVEADIIVNTANPHPIIGSGIDYAIYNAAGKDELLAEREKIGKIKRGEIAVTAAFNLKARYIIHAVGTRWKNGNQGEVEIVRSCYSKSLNKALELSAKSIAFPLLSSGNYGFPKDMALNIALSEIGRFLLTNEMNVILVVFDDTSFQLSQKITKDIAEFIDSQTVSSVENYEYDWEIERTYVRELINIKDCEQYSREQVTMSEESLSKIIKGKSLEEAISNADESFQEYLFKLIDERNLDDVTVYKGANIDRKLFSQIRRNKNYKPKKTTAVALSISLHLDMPTMLKLLSKAGLAFSANNKFDIIIAFFVNEKTYDINLINAALFKHNQPLLGIQA